MILPNKSKKCSSFSNSFLRAMRIDLCRAILSRRFVLSVFLSLFWSFFNGIFDVFLNQSLFSLGIPYILNKALTGDYGLGMLIFPISAVPFSISYLLDRESGFDRYVINRIGIRAYGLSRVISVAISACLVAFISGVLLLAILSLTGAPHMILDQANYGYGNYLDLVYQSGPMVYYCVRFTIFGLSCSTAAVFALWVSTLIPNFYVSLISPLVAYYGYGAIMSLLSLKGSSADLLHLFVLNYVINYQVSKDNWFSFLWATVYFLTIIILCAKGFLLRLGKEYET